MQSSYPAIYGDSQQGIHKIEVLTYPCVIAIILSYLDPEVDSTILQISILPKQSSVNTGVAMPAYTTSTQSCQPMIVSHTLILSTRKSMHIQNSVQV
jgi:hypothetical protein